MSGSLCFRDCTLLRLEIGLQPRDDLVVGLADGLALRDEAIDGLFGVSLAGPLRQSRVHLLAVGQATDFQGLVEGLPDRPLLRRRELSPDDQAVLLELAQELRK